MFWNPASGTMPEDVRRKKEKYTFKTDLHQVANLIVNSWFGAEEEAMAFSNNLKTVYGSAKEALTDAFLINN